MNLKRAGLLGMAVTFAQSPQGKRVLQQAKQHLDTPANRAKARELLAKRRQTPHTAPAQPTTTPSPGPAS